MIPYVVAITTAQFHSTKSELCASSNPARGVSKIRDGKDLWQWPELEIRLNEFRWSTILQKLFIIINNIASPFFNLPIFHSPLFTICQCSIFIPTEKNQKTSGVLMFTGCIEMKHWLEKVQWVVGLVEQS